MEDTDFATKFSEKLRSLGSARYPCNVPKNIEKRVIIAISLNLQDCLKNKTCKCYKGKGFYASMNNQSFVRPSLSILESYYNKGKTGHDDHRFAAPYSQRRLRDRLITRRTIPFMFMDTNFSWWEKRLGTLILPRTRVSIIWLTHRKGTRWRFRPGVSAAIRFKVNNPEVWIDHILPS
ncbi:hypothetical protein PanWU01x14_140120 [Parasponia andersonii]|uniref:Uncharacterized protein n=1 Tax=Parasponia andersonii TaxID=3476 RepID=A0A2P5CM99_PARAD|nr:hypothetical protein PanWU01x14_140120 [Parasponia andersonii]